jgi:hypothetical protein
MEVEWQDRDLANYCNKHDLLEDRMMDVEMSVKGAHTITGGKGWCPDPVHCKYIARKWTKNLPNTHPEYFKDIQNFPSQFN